MESPEKLRINSLQLAAFGLLLSAGRIQGRSDQLSLLNKCAVWIRASKIAIAGGVTEGRVTAEALFS
jgi:hypothetical protein